MPDEIQLPSLPDLKVIKDGKQVNTSAIDDYDGFMGFLMQASIAANTAKIRRYYDDRRSIGEVQNWELEITEDAQDVVCPQPARSLYVRNDGPGDIFVTINALGRTSTRLAILEEMLDNFETHELHCFYIWSAPGTIATVRAKVQY